MKQIANVIVPIALLAGSVVAQPAENPPTSAPVPADTGASATEEAPAVAPEVPEAPAQPEVPAAPAPVLAGYEKGFFIRSADGLYDLHIEARVQARYSYTAVEDDLDKSAFEIARARLTFAGKALKPGLTYKFQSDFGKGVVSLKDFYVNYDLGAAQIRAGQWKKPFSRQQITSSGKLEFVDRAATDAYFAAGRDIGVAIHNDYEKSPTFEWAVGIFNGTGEKPWLTGEVQVDITTGEGEIVKGKFTNVPDRFFPTIVARAGYNSKGLKGYSEADLEGGPLRYGVAVSAMADLDFDRNDSSSIRGELDFIAKVSGASFTGGVYTGTAQDGTSFTDQSYAALGAHVQAGYLFAKKYQPALRYEHINPKGADNDLHVLTAGLSSYFSNHEWKWQNEVSALFETATDATTWVARSQVQLAF